MQVKAGERAILLVELEWRDLINVPPVLGQSQVVFALAVKILRDAIYDVLAKRFRDAYALVGVFAR